MEARRSAPLTHTGLSTRQGPGSGPVCNAPPLEDERKPNFAETYVTTTSPHGHLAQCAKLESPVSKLNNQGKAARYVSAKRKDDAPPTNNTHVTRRFQVIQVMIYGKDRRSAAHHPPGNKNLRDGGSPFVTDRGTFVPRPPTTSRSNMVPPKAAARIGGQDSNRDYTPAPHQNKARPK